MSTGRRLAKRSIIGTKVCAPGPDGLWYSGVIQDVKTPPNPLGGQLGSMDSDTSLTTANTRYQVRFDFKTQSAGSGGGVIMDGRRANANNNSPTQTVRRNAMIKEFRESDLIGPGFRSILGIELLPGQRVFLTYNGRETSGDVVSHDAKKDEVVVKITAIGTEEPIELKKRLEEVRLLESRRSARLADQERDTDFARLADMGGDRRRTSHSIEVPLTVTPQTNSRKRPQACGHDCNGSQCNEDEMSDCRAAMILMNLSNSPKLQKNGDKRLGSSPSSSSSSSWSSGSSSPPLSDDGHPALHASPTTLNANDATASARIRTTSVSTSDEGIVVDFAPRKKKAHKTRFLCTWKGCKFSDHRQQKIEGHVRNVHLGSNKKPRHSAELEGTWRESDGEEEFYYTEIEDEDDEGHDTFHEGKQPSPTSPPTLSHRDMARPPHEDPEYQKQIVGKLKQGKVNGIAVQHQNNGKFIHNGSVSVSINSQQQPQHVYQVGNLPTSPLAHHNYTWPKAQSTPTTTVQPQQQQYSASSSHIKHTRSPRPSQSAAPYPSPTYLSQHHNYSSPVMPAHSSSTGGANQKVSQNVLHGNTKTNNVLQQLSQQNVTVTAHHCNGSSSTQQQGHRQQQQQQPQLSAVTITPNFHTISSSQSSHHQQQQQHHHQIATTINQTQANVPSSQSHQQQQHIHMQHAVATVRHTPNSPNRRTRGENKKCRKVYGMNRRDEWCIQCKWKKACTRFSD